MSPTEREEFENMKRELNLLRSLVTGLGPIQNYKTYSRNILLDRNLTLLPDRKLTVKASGQTYDYEFVHDVASGYFILRPTVAGAGGLLLGDSENNFYFGVVKINADGSLLLESLNDEVQLVSASSIQLQAPFVQMAIAGGGDNFYLRLPNGSGDPAATVTGALAVVGGKLKIYNGSAWVVVGTQS